MRENPLENIAFVPNLGMFLGCKTRTNAITHSEAYKLARS
jgi:hypothetical protein